MGSKTRHIIDTIAWVEYLLGSDKGQKVRKLITDEEELCTVECCLAEITSWALKNEKELAKSLTVIRSNSMTLIVKPEEWVEAGKVRHEERKRLPGFGLIDAALLVKQRALKCRLVSADRHFKGKRDVVFLG